MGYADYVPKSGTKGGQKWDKSPLTSACQAGSGGG
jgi:hypothetical protein